MSAPRTKSILLLENEILIAMDIEDMLAELEAGVIHHCASCGASEEWLKSNTPDFAILDIYLHDGLCIAVARILISRNIPFIVHSGSSKIFDNLDPIFTSGYWLPKPCTAVQWAAAIAAVS